MSMPSNSKTILSETTYPDATEEEPLIETGDKFKGDGFYGRSDGFHTLQYSLTGFEGVFKIQATIELDPDEKDWFTIIEKPYQMEDTEDISKTENFVGNYVWIRAKLTNWTDGTVKHVFMNH